MKTKTFAVLAAAAILAGCGLTPKQLEAIGKSQSSATMCHHNKFATFESTTSVTVAGVSPGQAGAVEVLKDCATRNVRGTAQ